jgi:glycosyltransferase involved in cell wall biosynthesis
VTGRPIKVAAFTGGKTISSRRFRVEQYIEPLRAHGVDVHEFVSRHGAWPPAARWKRPAWLLNALVERVGPVLASRDHDVTLLQRELISTLLTLEPWTGRPRVLDVDDAVWLNGARSRKNFARLASMCQGVLAGNQYIADAMSAWNPNILVLPTAVDTERFVPAHGLAPNDGVPIIGWSGLHAGSKYLLAIEPALARVLRERPRARLRIVSDLQPALRHVPPERVEFVHWSPANEVRTIQEMSVGLMPIDDTEWSKGKCSYKMLLYMACGVPVVVSPYGMNAEVLAHGAVGFGATTEPEWVEKVIELLDDADRRRMMGVAGRRAVEDHYSLHSLAPGMATFLRLSAGTS